MNQRQAFTLMELLVVMAIIAILAALLLSVFTGAKLRAQQIQCLNNVRQLSISSFMYANDNGRHAGNNTSAYPGGNWMGTLMDYYSAQNKIRLCPSAPVKNPPTQGNEQGYADRAWVRWTSDKKTMFYGSYGYNGWLYSDLKFSEPGDPKQQQLFTKESSIQKPAQTPVFFDENWVDTWPEEIDEPYTNLYEGLPIGPSVNLMGRCTIARHDSRSASRAPRNVSSGQKMPGAIDVGMADSHAELVKLENLWQLYWQLDWQSPMQRPQ
jgi:prepilin-type N-terminal cleavage/methylation domain-containing protein